MEKTYTSWYGCFLKWWVSPISHPKCWSFLVGKPMVVDTIFGNRHMTILVIAGASSIACHTVDLLIICSPQQLLSKSNEFWNISVMFHYRPSPISHLEWRQVWGTDQSFLSNLNTYFIPIENESSIKLQHIRGKKQIFETTTWMNKKPQNHMFSKSINKHVSMFPRPIWSSYSSKQLLGHPQPFDRYWRIGSAIGPRIFREQHQPTTPGRWAPSPVINGVITYNPYIWPYR